MRLLTLASLSFSGINARFLLAVLVESTEYDSESEDEELFIPRPSPLLDFNWNTGLFPSMDEEDVDGGRAGFSLPLRIRLLLSALILKNLDGFELDDVFVDLPSVGSILSSTSSSPKSAALSDAARTDEHRADQKGSNAE